MSSVPHYRCQVCGKFFSYITSSGACQSCFKLSTSSFSTFDRRGVPNLNSVVRNNGCNCGSCCPKKK